MLNDIVEFNPQGRRFVVIGLAIEAISQKHMALVRPLDDPTDPGEWTYTQAFIIISIA